MDLGQTLCEVRESGLQASFRVLKNAKVNNAKVCSELLTLALVAYAFTSHPCAVQANNNKPVGFRTLLRLRVHTDIHPKTLV